MINTLALNLIASVMSWDNERATAEYAWLRLMSSIKYDGYSDFRAGVRFLESLVSWLRHFDPIDRETAYALVRQRLVYISNAEMQRVIENFVPETVTPYLRKAVASTMGNKPFEVWSTKEGARAFSDRLRRCLFVGLCEDLRDRLLGRYSRPYAKKFLSSFKSALNQAVSDELIPRNPATDVFVLMSSRQKKANRIQIPELWEVQKLTDTIDALMSSPDDKLHKAWQRYGVMFYTQLYSGMRPTEVRGLPWKDVDWEQKCLHLTQDADQFCEIGLLKSGAAYRTIPLPDFIMEMLRTWQSICPRGEHDLVFPNWKGNVENHANIHRRGWYVLCRNAGFMETDDNGKESAKYPLNTLRHLKASLEIALGRPPKRIQELMGHEDIKLTFDTYGHLFKNEALKDDPNDITKLIASGTQETSKRCQMGAAENTTH